MFKITDSFWRALEARHSSLFDDLLGGGGGADEGDGGGDFTDTDQVSDIKGMEEYLRRCVARQVERKPGAVEEEEEGVNDISGLLSMVVCHLVSSDHKVDTKISSFSTDEPPPDETPGPVIALSESSDATHLAFTINAKRNHNSNSFGRPLCRVRCELNVNFDPSSTTTKTITEEEGDNKNKSNNAVIEPVIASTVPISELEVLVQNAGSAGIGFSKLSLANLTPCHESLVDLLQRAEATGTIILLRGPNRLKMPTEVLRNGRRLSSFVGSQIWGMSVAVHRDFAHFYSVRSTGRSFDQLRCPWITLSGDVNTRLLGCFRNKILSLLLDCPGATFAKIHAILVVLSLEQTQSLLNRLEIDERLIYHEDCSMTPLLANPWQQIDDGNDGNAATTSTHYFIHNNNPTAMGL